MIYNIPTSIILRTLKSLVALSIIVLVLGCSITGSSEGSEENIEVDIVSLGVRSSTLSYEIRYKDGARDGDMNLRVNSGPVIMAQLNGNLDPLFEGMIITAGLRIFNPNPSAVRVNFLQSDILLDGQKVTSISFGPNTNLASSADSIRQVRFTIPNNVDLRTIVKSNTITFKGRTNAGLFINNSPSPGVDVPFEVERENGMEDLRDYLARNKLDIENYINPPPSSED